jgi:DNA-binding MarR family transcriptional regulator
MDTAQDTTQDSLPAPAEASEALSPRTRIHLDNFLPAIIRNLSEGISARISKNYSDEFSLTITEWRILLQLSEHRLLTASQIVDNTAMEKSKISRALSSMEGDGMVKREVDKDDHRRQLLALTDYGDELYCKVAPLALEWEKQLLQGLDINEYRDLIFLLNKLSQQLKTMD